MANARPLDALRSAPSARKHATPAAGNASPNGTLFGGTRLVGTFFGSSSPTDTNWSCTGSVIDTPARNVILTAAHCGLGYGNNYIFVPKFIKGAGPDQQPYGIFHIQHVFIDPRYIPDTGHSSTKKPWSALATAFARVSANQRGRQLQDAVGGGLTFTQPTGYNHKDITIVGCPGKDHNGADDTRNHHAMSPCPRGGADRTQIGEGPQCRRKQP
ncbi:hypothetical protein ACFTY8_33355 [Streptomyces mirabilis]|uniref:hypothetical protein n=1 Tax=Streptomyces mirabilis TaxID=68239 RepID=UPI003635D838